MNPKELGNLRLKQVAVTNGIILTVMMTFFIIITVFTITFTQFYIVLGILILVQAIFGLIKGDSTKSFISVFEKVAIYEKQKMGREWYKQRRVGYIWNLILSGLMFLQAYWNLDTPENVFQIDLMFMFIITFFLLLLINISMIIHFRKVDNSTSELDIKGYTWKSNLIAVAVGFVFAIIMIFVTIFYII